MKLHLKSISVKMTLLYLFLAIVNISVFTIMIYENQIDLITENSKYHIRERTEDFIASLQKISAERGNKKIFRLENRDQVIREVSGIIHNKLIGKDSLIIFTEDGTVLHKSQPGLKLGRQDIKNGITAVANQDYTGRRIFSTLDEKSFVISFYIPYVMPIVGDTILLLKIEMRDFKRRLVDLYLIIMVIIVFLALFHGIFATIFHRMFIQPIQALHEKSLEISRGDLDARADIRKDDEIGQLGVAFNSMADSIQEKIITLQRQRDQTEDEMDVASGVQQLIYPRVTNDSRFNYAVFHKSLGKVSGDYYDVIRLEGAGTGYLMVDVSGHGMPAALVTMLVKEIFAQSAPLYKNPADLIRYMNREARNLLTRENIHLGVYFTAIYLMIDEKNVLSYCNAGHEEALLIKTKSRRLLPLTTTGGPVGISPMMDDLYATSSIRLEGGDKIVLYTDGIIEARSPEGKEFGMAGLQESIKKRTAADCEQLLRGITDDLTWHIGAAGLKDDATIFLIDVK
ncbi:MAG: SpoIIE family protein phosphatase [Spirochaetes bacterium]|nr:SpoIIE family protein phosphatase [Spirochaetota bacterium]